MMDIPISGGVCGAIDCDDANPLINPGAVKVCNNDIDDDCDNLIDENLKRACGSGSCSGTETCSNGVWGTCSTNTNPCDDNLYCTQNTVCSSGICGGGQNICEEDTNGNKCVDVSEITIYMTDWLNNIRSITQIKVTNAADKWLTGVSACN